MTTTMQLRQSNKRKLTLLVADAMTDCEPVASLPPPWKEEGRVPHDGQRRNCDFPANTDPSEPLRRRRRRRQAPKLLVEPTSRKPSERWLPSMDAPRLAVVPEPSHTERSPNSKRVRFAPWVTVRCPILEEENVVVDSSSWYGPEDYARFALDCRRTIQAVVHPSTTAETAMEEELPILQGLEDFASFEAKNLRSYRRLAHCYNILYHQFMLLQQQPAEDDDDDTRVSLLQRISERSSHASLQLALCRGKERALE